MKQPNIDPADEDFGTILNCAVRYSIGRQTYMPKLVMDFIKPLLPYLTNRTLWCIEKDITGSENYGDPNIDKPEWMRFLDAVRTELKRREDKNGKTQTSVRILQEL